MLTAGIARIVASGDLPDLAYAHTRIRTLNPQSQIRSSKARSYLFAIETCLERSRKDAGGYGTKITCRTAVQQHHTVCIVGEGIEP